MSSSESKSPAGPLEALALDFEQATMHGQQLQGSKKVLSALMRHTSTQLATGKEPVRSSAAVEIAFTSSLAGLKAQLSERAQSTLLEYVVDYMPHDLAEYRPKDPYFQATLEVFGVQALFDHVTRKGAADDYGQLSLDIQH